MIPGMQDRLAFQPACLRSMQGCGPIFRASMALGTAQISNSDIRCARLRAAGGTG
jgi:hypothetical protein